MTFVKLSVSLMLYCNLLNVSLMTFVLVIVDLMISVLKICVPMIFCLKTVALMTVILTTVVLIIFDVMPCYNDICCNNICSNGSCSNQSCSNKICSNDSCSNYSLFNNGGCFSITYSNDSIYSERIVLSAFCMFYLLWHLPNDNCYYDSCYNNQLSFEMYFYIAPSSNAFVILPIFMILAITVCVLMTFVPMTVVLMTVYLIMMVAALPAFIQNT